MSWIQENKFTAGVLGAAVVVSGVLFYLGYSARSEAEQIREASNTAVAKTNALKRNQPFPSAENQQLVITKVANFTQEALGFQASLLAFRPEELPNLSESAFGTKVSEHRELLSRYYREKGVALREGGKGVAFGLEDYAGGKLPRGEATRVLNYERKALEWMFKKLADAGPDSLDNVYRTQVLEEKAAAPTKGRSRKKSRKSNRSAKVESVYRAMPIEVTFTGTEKALKEFLKELSNAEEYFFITRSVKIRNLEVESPDLNEGEFKAAPAAINGFGGEGFEVLQETGKPILKQVTGTEKIKVHLKLDLALFKEANEVTFPGADKLKKKASKEVVPATPAAPAEPVK